MYRHHHFYCYLRLHDVTIGFHYPLHKNQKVLLRKQHFYNVNDAQMRTDSICFR